MAAGMTPNMERWTPLDDAVLFCHYKEGRADACMPLLPNRTRAAINQRATRKGLSMPIVIRSWSQPRMEPEESLDCVRMNSWLGAATIGHQLGPKL